MRVAPQFSGHTVPSLDMPRYREQSQCNIHTQPTLNVNDNLARGDTPVSPSSRILSYIQPIPIAMQKRTLNLAYKQEKGYWL